MARKSLGTLTIDLVARTGGFVQGMDKAERASSKWRKQVEKDAKAAGEVIGKSIAAGVAAATAAVAATAALTKKGLEAATAQADLAESLNTTYDSITALKLAASDANLDGLDGSLTRLNRRLGAAERGAGAAASAVKALNLDLGALSKMDVAERVATIADAIRDSGASMQATARYAQDLGFEQKEAAKFFSQGGDALREYVKQVDEFGLSLSEIDAATIQLATTEFGKIGRLIDGVSQQLAAQFAPLILQVSKDITELSRETGGFAEEIEELTDRAVSAVAFVASSVDGVGRVFSALGKSAAVVFLGLQLAAYRTGDSFVNGPIEAVNELIELLNIIPGIDIEPRALSGIGSQIKAEIAILQGAIAEGQRDIQDGLLEPLAGERLIKYYNDAKTAAEGAARAAVDLKEATAAAGVLEDPAARRAREAAEKAAVAAEKARLEGIAREITALERAAATWGMTADQVKIYGLETQGATEAQLAHAQSLLDTVSGLEKAKKEQEDYLRLVQDLRTDEERLTDQFHERIAILDAVAASASIAADEYARMASRAAEAAFSDAPSFGGVAPEVGGPAGELIKIDEAAANLQEWYDTQLQMLEQFREERSDLNAQWDEREAELHQEHQDRLAEIERARQMVQLAAGEEFFGHMSSAAKAFFGENSKLYQAAFALEKSYAVAKALLNVPKSYSDAYAAVVGIPVVGPALAPVAGAAAAAAQVAQAAALGSVSLKGQAHDGIDSVPQTGTWLLEKGERVTTAETSAKLDRTLDEVRSGAGSGGVVVNLVEDSSRAGQVSERQQDEQTIIDIVVASIRGDGDVASAIGGKYSLETTGR